MEKPPYSASLSEQRCPRCNLLCAAGGEVCPCGHLFQRSRCPFLTSLLRSLLSLGAAVVWAFTPGYVVVTLLLVGLMLVAYPLLALDWVSRDTGELILKASLVGFVLPVFLLPLLVREVQKPVTTVPFAHADLDELPTLLNLRHPQRPDNFNFHSACSFAFGGLVDLGLMSMGLWMIARSSNPYEALLNLGACPLAASGAALLGGLLQALYARSRVHLGRESVTFWGVTLFAKVAWVEPTGCFRLRSTAKGLELRHREHSDRVLFIPKGQRLGQRWSALLGLRLEEEDLQSGQVPDDHSSQEINRPSLTPKAPD